MAGTQPFRPIPKGLGDMRRGTGNLASLITENSCSSQRLVADHFSRFPSSMPIARSEVFSAYRHLLRSIAIAFHGDHATLSAARQEARRRFKEQQHLNPESAKAMEALTEAQSVGRFLRQNLVQGVKAEGEERYRICGILRS